MANLFSNPNSGLGGVTIFQYTNEEDYIEELLNSRLSSYYTKLQSDDLYFRIVAQEDLNMNNFTILNVSDLDVSGDIRENGEKLEDKYAKLDSSNVFTALQTIESQLDISETIIGMFGSPDTQNTLSITPNKIETNGTALRLNTNNGFTYTNSLEVLSGDFNSPVIRESGEKLQNKYARLSASNVFTENQTIKADLEVFGHVDISGVYKQQGVSLSSLYADINHTHTTSDITNLASYTGFDNYYTKINSNNRYAIKSENNTFTGTNTFDTATNTKPLNISRVGTTAQNLQIGLTDAECKFLYKNDESASRMRFRLENTDTEGSNGAQASTYEILTLEANSTGSRVGINNTDPNSAYSLDVNGAINGITIYENGSSLASLYADINHTHTTSDITDLGSYTGFDSRYLNADGDTITGKLNFNTGGVNGYLFYDATYGISISPQFAQVSGMSLIQASGSLNILDKDENIKITLDTSTGNISANEYYEAGSSLASLYGSLSQQQTNTSNISTNTSNISTNTSNISTNTSNISTNTSNISTNTSNISTNTDDIASNLQFIQSVSSDLTNNYYDKTETDNRYAIKSANNTFTGDQTFQSNVPELLFRSANGTSNGYGIKANISDVADFGLIIEDKDGNDLFEFQAGGANISYNDFICNGDVGIGTTDPSGKLHISSGDSGDCALILEADTDNNNENDNPRIEFWQDGGLKLSAIYQTNNRLNIANSVSTDEGIVFSVNDVDGWSNANELMRLTKGLIRITGDDEILRLDGGANGNNPYITFYNDDVRRWALGTISSGNNNFYIYDPDGNGGDILLASNGNGNVGIGTDSPDSGLTVASNLDALTTQKGVHMGLFNSQFAGIEMVSSAAAGGWIDFKAETGGNSDYQGRIRYRNDSNSLEFHTNNIEQLRIDENGNLGIGTNNPIAKLQVNGNVIIKRPDTENAFLGLYGDSQGCGRVYVGQSTSFGGGIEYNGDNNPTTTGAGNDYITLWRRDNGVDSWTARNKYSNNDWEFRGDVKINENVGIGGNANNVSSFSRLEVNGKTIINTTQDVNKTDNESGALIIGDINGIHLAIDGNEIMPRRTVSTNNTDEHYLYFNADSGDNGRILIGSTGTPNCPVQVASANNVSGYSTYISENTQGQFSTSSENTSLYVNAGLGASWIAFHSDERIKRNIIPIDDRSALDLVNKIETYKYQYKDRVQKGDQITYGFIAQQVKEHLPNAITYQREAIPNIYKISKDFSFVELETPVEKNKYRMIINDISFNEGTTYRFIMSNEGQENGGIVNSLCISGNSFLVRRITDNVFVYGEEIDDFHIVDKHKIYALHHSAIQQLDKNQRNLTDKVERTRENTELIKRVEYLESQNKQLQDKLNNMNEYIKSQIEKELRHAKWNL